mmetsp:Transcript_8852/g.18881  ORF Transcript_8852/g.18881 Transcript_8852/m.18881 type:complete len:270 (+) Transcript_8852:262-1071(+)
MQLHPDLPAAPDRLRVPRGAGARWAARGRRLDGAGRTRGVARVPSRGHPGLHFPRRRCGPGDGGPRGPGLRGGRRRWRRGGRRGRQPLDAAHGARGRGEYSLCLARKGRRPAHPRGRAGETAAATCPTRARSGQRQGQWDQWLISLGLRGTLWRRASGVGSTAAASSQHPHPQRQALTRQRCRRAAAASAKGGLGQQGRRHSRTAEVRQCGARGRWHHLSCRRRWRSRRDGRWRPSGGRRSEVGSRSYEAGALGEVRGLTVPGPPPPLR